MKGFSPAPLPTTAKQDPAAFADKLLPLNEKGQPWKLNRYQRRVLTCAFRRGRDGRLLFRILLWSEVKKSGKTFIAAVLVLSWAFTHPNTEVILAANDLEQSTGRVFQTCVALLEHNPLLAKYVTIRATRLELSNGTVVRAISSDYRGEAGPRHSLVVFDELWGYDSERLYRLFEELTPPPTEPDAWMLIVTYAGFTGESKLLEDMYQRGLAGEHVDDELECYEAEELFMFWSHTPRQPWQTEQYYAEQARILRPNTFRRLHLNQWISNEEQFFTGEQVDARTDGSLTPLLPTQDEELFGGLDAAPKGDRTAAVFLAPRGNRLVLAQHRIWRGTPAQPLDFEHTVEAYLRQMCKDYVVRAIYYDPYQLHRSAMSLRAEGIPMVEYPQTVPNLTRLGQGLYNLVRGGNLVLYPDAELREHLLNCVAVESPRGFVLRKQKASRKIDAAVALGMACCAAFDHPARELFDFWQAGMRDRPGQAVDALQPETGSAEIQEACLTSGFWWPAQV